MNGLTPEFRAKVEQLLARLKARGVEMRPYSFVRTPAEQAALWRQGRASEEIAAKCARFRSLGAPRIAACIEAAGPQHGRRVTNAAPGYSMHNWGWAVDCFRVANGKADWREASYREYAVEARELGLKAGADFDDHPHVQWKHDEISRLYQPAAIDAAMAERFPAFAALR